MENVVLITVDSLRADYCGHLNSSHDLTPNIDRIADEGVAFEQAIAPGPRTPSSMPVIWTGQHIDNWNRGVYTTSEEKENNWRERRHRLKRHLTRYQTLAERLKNLGYNTGAVTTNPWTTPDTGFDRGFDCFRVIDGSSQGIEPMENSLVDRTLESLLPADRRRWFLRWPAFYSLIEEMKNNLAEPYFLWIFLLDTHQPYLAPKEYRVETGPISMYYGSLGHLYYYNNHYYNFGRTPDHLDSILDKAYRDSIRSVDGFVGQLLTDLEHDDPTVVVHSDHGDAFGEHGTFGHRPQVYEENIRVPLVVGGVADCSRITEQVSLKHLSDLVLWAADHDAVEFSTPEELTDSYVVSRTEEDERATVRSGDWKYIFSVDDWEYIREGSDEEMYNLSIDAEEKRDLVKYIPKAKDALNNLLSDHNSNLSERTAIADSVGALKNTDSNLNRQFSK